MLLLQRGVFQMEDSERKALLQRLRGEREDNSYRDVTRGLVELFQEQLRLEGEEERGTVDEPTANALNALLDEWEHSARQRLSASG